MQLTLGIYDRCDLIDQDLQCSLENVGHNIVCIAEEQSDFKKCIKSIKPHIIIVSLGSSNVDEVIAHIDNLGKTVNIGIIYLSKESEEHILKKVALTRFVQFLVLPCNVENILSAISLSAYRHKLFTLPLGENYTYNPHSKELFEKDAPIPLTNNESKLLYLLVQARGNIVSKELVDHEIWPNKTINHTTIRTLLCRLRKKIPNVTIQQVSNIGYKLIRTKNNQ